MFSMSKKKFCILILAFISLVFSFNMVKSTYAKYVTSNDKTTDVNLAKWDILVNGEYIKSSKTLSATLTPSFVESSYTAEGYLAPGTQAYFDVIVDNTYVDVDYNYIASVAPVAESRLSDLRITKVGIYEVDDHENPIVDTTKDQTTTGNQANINGYWYNGITPTKYCIRVYVEWFDGEGETMNDDEDTVIGHNAANLGANEVNNDGRLTIKLRFVQVTNHTGA
jgi:hypothetical protein